MQLLEVYTYLYIYIHLAETGLSFQKEPGLRECCRGTTGSGSPHDIAHNSHCLCCFVHVQHIVAPICIFISPWKDVALKPAPCKTYRIPRLLPKKKTGAIWTDSDYLNSIIFHLYNLAIDHDESEDQNHSTPCFFPDLTIGINEFLCAAKVRWPWRGGFDDFKLVSHTTWLILAYQVHRHFPSLSNMLTKHHAAWSWSKSMSSKCNPLTNLIQTWCQN